MVALMVSVIDILIYMTYVCVCVYAEKVNCLLCSILMDGTPDQLHIEQLLCEEEYCCHVLYTVATYCCHVLYTVATYCCHVPYTVSIFCCHVLHNVAIYCCHMLCTVVMHYILLLYTVVMHYILLSCAIYCCHKLYVAFNLPVRL